MAYIRRNLEDRTNRLLSIFPVVMLIGARQTGKTTLSRAIRPEWNYFDLENAVNYDFMNRHYDFFSRNIPAMSSLMRLRNAQAYFGNSEE